MQVAESCSFKALQLKYRLLVCLVLFVTISLEYLKDALTQGPLTLQVQISDKQKDLTSQFLKYS